MTKNAQAVELLGQILLELGKPELSIDLFRRLFDRCIVTFDPRQLLVCAYRLHRDDDVMAICEELHTRGPSAGHPGVRTPAVGEVQHPQSHHAIKNFLQDHPENKLALLRLSVIGVLQGLPELVHAEQQDMPPVEQLPVEYLMPALGVMRKAAEAEQAIDYAYRYLRTHFDQREAHEAFIHVVSRVQTARPSRPGGCRSRYGGLHRRNLQRSRSPVCARRYEHPFVRVRGSFSGRFQD